MQSLIEQKITSSDVKNLIGKYTLSQLQTFTQYSDLAQHMLDAVDKQSVLMFVNKGQGWNENGVIDHITGREVSQNSPSNQQLLLFSLTQPFPQRLGTPLYWTPKAFLKALNSRGGDVDSLKPLFEDTAQFKPSEDEKYLLAALFQQPSLVSDANKYQTVLEEKNELDKVLTDFSGQMEKVLKRIEKLDADAQDEYLQTLISQMKDDDMRILLGNFIGSVFERCLPRRRKYVLPHDGNFVVFTWFTPKLVKICGKKDHDFYWKDWRDRQEIQDRAQLEQEHQQRQQRLAEVNRARDEYNAETAKNAAESKARREQIDAGYEKAMAKNDARYAREAVARKASEKRRDASEKRRAAERDASAARRKQLSEQRKQQMPQQVFVSSGGRGVMKPGFAIALGLGLGGILTALLYSRTSSGGSSSAKQRRR